MNGKGDKLRKGANLKAYYDNYDKIFKKQSTSNHHKISETGDKSQSTVIKRDMDAQTKTNAI